MDSKAKGTDGNVINLELNGSINKDQTKVANCLVDYFTMVANDIGDPRLLSLTEQELEDHESVLNIRKVAATNGKQFKFRNINVKEVTRALETLNPNTSTGHDMISPGVLKLASNVLAPSLTNIRELKQRRRRRQRERHKTMGLISKNNSSARAFYVLYISLPSSAKQQREMTKFKVLWRT